MSLVYVKIQMELLSDTIFSSGNSSPGGEDIALRVDNNGRPFLPGSTFKGLLRESMTNYLCWTDGDEIVLHELLGEPGKFTTETNRRLIFGDLRPEGEFEEESDWADTRTFTKLQNGVVETGTLRSVACLRQGLVLSGILLCDSGDVELLKNSTAGIQWVGLLRNRGFGHVKTTVIGHHALKTMEPVEKAYYLHYHLRVETPLSIPWLTKSGAAFGEERNYTESRNYLPGSAVRGMVMSALAQRDPLWFTAHKSELLQHVQFQNALPLCNEDFQIPTPMGFYTDRERTSFYNVLNQMVEPGHKRARLGNFCCLKDGCIHTSSPAMETALRIKRGQGEDKQVFTIRAMATDTELEGYIHLENPALACKISEAFREWVWLGADRYAGNGLCRVLALNEINCPHHFSYSYCRHDLIPDTLYLLLLSPTTMTIQGEAVGLDEDGLARLLGVKNIHIYNCSTAITEAAGFNRTWGCAAPSMTMYEAGSLFCLHCSSPPTWEAIRKLEQTGIGIRRTEGYGQVLFLKDFSKITNYAQPEGQPSSPAQTATARQARCKWLLAEVFPKELSASQMGTVQALCEQIISGKATLNDLETFFLHNKEDRGVRHGSRFADTYQKMKTIWETPIGETVQFSNYPDSLHARLQLICDWIDLNRKGETM